jgi:peptide/nickel transport system ATP-binding protein
VNDFSETRNVTLPLAAVEKHPQIPDPRFQIPQPIPDPRSQIPQPILAIRDLRVEYHTAAGKVLAVDGAGFELHPGESIALIGESGSGKTTLGLGLLRLLPKSGRTSAGQILYRRRDGEVVDVLQLPNEEMRRFRWQECAMVFQAAQNALNPVARVWDQMLDTVRAHRSSSRDEIRQRCERLLRMVQLEPRRVLYAFPHELSGGMRQRVLIAMSLLLDPQVLILDEPTTALDILTQRAIIDVLQSLRAELRFAMLFISHDLSLAAELADRVATMYAGKIVEIGSVRDLFYNPKHPYTLGLIKAVPPVAGDLFDISSIPGAPPSLLNLPSGCSFHPRCVYARERCTSESPPLYPVGDTHASACHYWSEVQLERTVVETSD